MLSAVWKIENPREYQIKAIFYLVFLRVRMLYLIRKTGEGKSLVLLGTATMLRGVTICLVPLLGLESSQASKSRSTKHRVEGYHVDEYRDQDFDLLSQRMRLFSRKERSSIIVYISPQNLKQGSKWCRLLTDMAAAGYISSVCIDEAHATVEQCESFRPEFKDAIQTIKNLISVSKIHHPGIDIPMLVMSATFRIPEQISFNRLIGSQQPELVMWGPMDRRSVGIFTRVDGEPLSHLVNSWVVNQKKNPDMKSLIMTNSAAAADGRIIDRLEKVSKQLPPSVFNRDNCFMSFTGDCCLMMKMMLMESFCGEGNESLPTIVCMPCTEAAHCGVSSKKCKQCYRYGPCPNWYGAG
jgi:superfamily II DNA helicase RecQ